MLVITISHFPTMFSRGFFFRVVKSHCDKGLNTLRKIVFEKIVGKGGNAGNYSFSTIFSTLPIPNSVLKSYLFFLSAKLILSIQTSFKCSCLEQN